ncbi:MAG: GNAT family N-acetyltransferase [Oceanicoccus sp.]
MEQPRVLTASAESPEKVMAILLLAFSADPFARWVMSDADNYIKHYRRFIYALGGRAFEHNAAFFLDDYSAAALWLPPGVSSDENLIASMIQEIVPEELLGPLVMLDEELKKYHPEVCWYLSTLGVDIKMQGSGRGALIMREQMRVCDESSSIAYLESSNPANRPFYERYGFEAMGEINVGNPATMTPMIRYPRG